MSADRLREAAKVLRERAQNTPAGPWFFSEGTHGDPSGGPTYVSVVSKDSGHPVCMGNYDGHDGHAAVYIATMHPGVGVALADWLDTAGSDVWAYGPMCKCDDGCHLCDHVGWMPHARRALRVADLILGGASS